MAEQESKIEQGQVITAFYKNSQLPVELKVALVVDDTKVILTPDGKKTYMTNCETIIKGGSCGRVQFKPQAPTLEH